MRVEDSDMIYRGSNELARVYRGDHVIVWEPRIYEGMYLTMKVVDTQTGGTLNYVDPTYGAYRIDISIDGGNTWIPYSAATQQQKTLQVGDTVMVRGNNATYARYNWETGDYDEGSTLGILNADYILYGNAMSLIYGDDFSGKTTLYNTGDHNKYCFMSLFMPFGEGDRLINAGNLILPATTLAEGCYWAMFKDCEYLEKGPTLPATTIAEECYKQMFENCLAMTTAQDILPATTLAMDCYWSMYAATHITRAPELPAVRLVDGCYWSMFHGCQYLNYIKCLAQYNMGGMNTSGWVNGVAATGTFINAFGSNTWTIGNSGIPSGWTGYTTQAINEYTTLDIISGGTLANKSWYYDGQWHEQSGNNLYYSVNGNNWFTLESYRNLILSAGDKVRIKGDISDRGGNVVVPTFSGSTCYFNVYGNARSLTDSDNFTGTTGNYSHGFTLLFSATNVVSANDFILPDGHYMYYEFGETFSDCPYLVEAPVIRGEYADANSMDYMFTNCPNLDRLECNFEYFDNNAAANWLDGVSQTGTFVKKRGVSYPSGVSGIPTGWTVEEF